MNKRRVNKTTRPDRASDRADEPSANPIVVGVGASAGGLEAVSRLLRALPPEPDAALVFIQHLDPAHGSVLPELLSKTSPIPVTEATDGIRLEKNHVYVATPGTEVRLENGHLAVSRRLSHATVDLFLRSLADQRGNRAIGVVLSGTGSDGTLGLLAIRAEGGVTFAQEPDSTDHDGMPRSAISSGAVDRVLLPEEIAAEIARLARHPYAIRQRRDADREEEPSDGTGFASIVRTLRVATGVDFGDYKPTTILRRAQRRMAIRSIERIEQYAEMLKGERHEVQALFEDVLIHVTSFFRDPDVFEALKRDVFPAILARKSEEGAFVKIWVPGCSSGEEAYSIAIALLEYLADSGQSCDFQVFATDLDESLLTKGRACCYPETISQDVSAERLARFFKRIDGGYQILPMVRERCIFARHNLLQDPPFSRNDFISCRNVLIYFGTEVQRRLIPTFHYALNPEGYLMLGGSESVGAFGDLFEATNPKHKIFLRKNARSLVYFGASTSRRKRETPWPGLAPSNRPGETATVLQKRTDELLVQKFAPPAVVVDSQFDVVQFRGDSSRFLVPAPGTASLNLLRMAREGLQVGLREALEESKRTGKATKREKLLARREGETAEVAVEVVPVATSGAEATHHLVLFHEATPEGVDPSPQALPARERTASPTRSEADGRITALENELASTRTYLQGIIGEREEANEELQALNEEVVSANEELQSINEELQTAKEELQSGNEELTTLNDELGHRNAELTRLHDDLTNILGGIGAPVLVVDRELRIRRISSGAENVFAETAPLPGMILSEGHTSFDFARLKTVLQDVFDSGASSSLPYQREDGRKFLLRAQPYRLSDGRRDGLVLILFDVDELERRVAQRTAELRESNDQMVMFSYSVSHDLRAPIRAMRGYAEAILEDYGESLGEVGRRQAKEIAHSADRLDRLILSLLDYSRAGAVELPPAPTSLSTVVEQTLQDMQPELEEGRAHLSVELSDLLPEVMAHEPTLHQVIRNLVGNAIKFVRPGTEPRVMIRAEARGARVRLWVVDNGIGIAPEYQRRVFSVFERLHPADVYPGVGIGLAFVKRSIERMGGEAGVEGERDEGSRFWVELPAAPTNEMSAD